MVSPYLRVSAVSAARPLRDARESCAEVVQAGGVRRDVGRQVRQQVGELGQPVGPLAGLGVVFADGVQRGPGPPPRRRARRGCPGRSTTPRGPAQQRPGGCRRSPAGPPRPQVAVLPRQGLDGGDLVEPEPQQVGLAGAAGRPG